MKQTRKKNESLEKKKVRKESFRREEKGNGGEDILKTCSSGGEATSDWVASEGLSEEVTLA